VIAAAGIDVLRPRHLKDALMMMRVAADEGHPLVPMAGGTDLFVTLNAGQKPAARYLDLWRLDKLRGVRADGKRGLWFGGLATYTDCIDSKAVQKRLPILVDAARQVGGVQIQNRGTLAGNIENGSPAADGVPVLMAADARVVLRSLDAARTVPLAEYYTGYRKTVRQPDELIEPLEAGARCGDDLQRGDKWLHRLRQRRLLRHIVGDDEQRDGADLAERPQQRQVAHVGACRRRGRIAHDEQRIHADGVCLSCSSCDVIAAIMTDWRAARRAWQDTRRY